MINQSIYYGLKNKVTGEYLYATFSHPNEVTIYGSYVGLKNDDDLIHIARFVDRETAEHVKSNSTHYIDANPHQPTHTIDIVSDEWVVIQILETISEI